MTRLAVPTDRSCSTDASGSLTLTTMLRLRTIVAALDFSPGSATALVRAADLAARSHAALHVLHADVLFRSPGDGAPPADSPSSTLRVRVERFAAETLGGPDALDALGPTVAVVRDMTAEVAILRYAAEAEADVLVVGTHGRSGLARLLLGSVAEAVVASASCPVLTVPDRGSAGPGPDAPVLVAVDFSERSRVALAAGVALAEPFGAPVEVVHVARHAGAYFGVSPNVLSVSDAYPDEDAAVRERLHRFAEGVPGLVLAAAHVVLGAPSHVVPALAADRGAGALVLGTHGRTGLSHALIGSVAEGALRRASCPVLTLKETEASHADRVPVRSALAS